MLIILRYINSREREHQIRISYLFNKNRKNGGKIFWRYNWYYEDCKCSSRRLTLNGHFSRTCNHNLNFEDTERIIIKIKYMASYTNKYTNEIIGDFSSQYSNIMINSLPKINKIKSTIRKFRKSSKNNSLIISKS